MAKHHPDLIMCWKQPGIAIGRLCEKCDGKCVICDSYIHPCTLVWVCDECNYGSFQGWCVICGGVGSSDTMKDSNIYIEMKWKWRKEAESEEQRMNESVMHREAEDEIIALFYYLLLLNCLHYYFSLYICSIGRYCTENMLSFTLNIMLTNSLLLTNTANRMLTILIANLLTLGIIRTVDIFTVNTLCYPLSLI